MEFSLTEGSICQEDSTLEDGSLQAPSISEDLMTISVEVPQEEGEEEDEKEEDDETRG